MEGTRVVDSATCALVRSWRSREVFLAHRVAGHRSFPDQWVFPGGRVEEADRRADVAGLSGEDAAFHSCAAREVFEETGVLLAHPVRAGADLAGLRRELVAGRLSFERVLETTGARLTASDLAHLGTKTTPPFAPLRFRNRFCMAELPPGPGPQVWPGELDAGRWLRVEEALDLWARMELRLVPPVLLLLEGWGAGDAAEARARLAGFDDAHFERRLPRVRFAPG
ncbi:MAG: NUDIX domain-containing protein, partial [Planctomycetes bacterium]|nr:NUDIX domain-containing protein [Planctomycetota bacterium]